MGPDADKMVPTNADHKDSFKELWWSHPRK